MNLDKFNNSQQRYDELEQLLADPKVISDNKKYQSLAKEMAELTPIIVTVRKLHQLLKQRQELTAMLEQKQDQDFLDLISSELKELERHQQLLEKELHEVTHVQKQEKDRDLIMEIRAGTGGAEAALFAGDLYRMYTRFADRRHWKVDVMSSSAAEAGGFKEIVFGISGQGASQCLKWESGAHRVQRVPNTEASGRIHTSAATVVVLFEPEEIELKIDPKDLKIDVFRSSGPGGQSVNTTDSAIRITHLPTGTVVACQDERSQLKNRMKAMRVLRARILDKLEFDKVKKETTERKAKVGSGDRSEKIRTYNFPDRRVTDHRIGFTSHKLNGILDGEMDDLIEALIQAEQNASAIS
jgi:peptide chain release factor 1